MKKYRPYILLIILTLFIGGFAACQKDSVVNNPAPSPSVSSSETGEVNSNDYTGSVSCIECHEKFYSLWSNSHHGLAMQPYTSEFSKKELTAHENFMKIGEYEYKADTEKGVIIEKTSSGEEEYEIIHVLGGKNVYYFLTPLERGYLQVLPLAYDVHKKEWYDTAKSGIRHFAGTEECEELMNWRDRVYTFNTSCYGCHVSQYASNYDLETDTYNTEWKEPGINCEACHGPGEEHIKVCVEAPEGTVPEDMKIISTTVFTKQEINDLCAPCHAKMMPLTDSFKPKDRFFDCYDLVVLDNPDYYPDGRDLGENYTYTSWLMSPCVKSGELDCMHCHTSSGRYRFAEENFNDACMPCHENHVTNSTAHTHHEEDSEGNKCISCHMPLTAFAFMNRSDHSMRPPTPLATIKFKSPNACNICHTDENSEWANENVTEWRGKDYQKKVIYEAELIQAGRDRNWEKLPEMLSYLKKKDKDEILAASIIRLLQNCPDQRVWPAFIKALGEESPLIRSSAASALSGYYSSDAIAALVEATGDDYRLVRIRAAMALTGAPDMHLPDKYKETVEKAMKDLFESLAARPDDWSTHYNKGNIWLDRKKYKEAVMSYETALKLEPLALLPLVNMSLAYSRSGNIEEAEKVLKKALEREPKNPVVNFNFGLLMAELGNTKEAEHALRLALEEDPQMAQAAYNLAIIVSENNQEECIKLCKKAAELAPYEPKYLYSLAFYQNESGDKKGAIKTLETLVKTVPNHYDGIFFLGGLYEETGQIKEAEALYTKIISNGQTPEEVKTVFSEKLKSLEK